MKSAAQEMGAFTGSIKEQCEQFGIILGLKGPVSEKVLLRLFMIQVTRIIYCQHEGRRCF